MENCGFCGRRGFGPACASAKSDRDPYCSLLETINVEDTVSEQNGSGSECADAQAGLSPCWSQDPQCWFLREAAQIILISRSSSNPCDLH